MKKPFFSVIIPTFNRGDFLKIAIDSLLSQDFSDFELIIVDDGSNDNTDQIIKDLTDPRIRYIKQNHRGVSGARNNGLKQASGEFICFLDSDDRFSKDKLLLTHKFIKNNQKYKVFHTKEIWYRNGSLLNQKARHKNPHGFAFAKIAKLCCISISTIAIEKNVFNQVGTFDETMPACEDYDFLLRITAAMPVFLIPKALTIKEGGHSDQQSKKFKAMDKFRIYALEKILPSLSGDNYKIAHQELKNKCTIYLKGAVKRDRSSEIEYYQQLLAQL
ncbi:MAG: glycosyltransferase [Candidatus Omnitrophica bacterium]|nr:glycosyltransferase [Candidatus Omnitrophota bacterium]